MALALIGCGKTADEAPKAGEAAKPTEPTQPVDVAKPADPDSKGGTVITADGVFVDGAKVPDAKVGDAAKALAADKEPTYVVIDTDAGRAGPIVDVLKAVAGAWPEYNLVVMRAGKRSMLCENAGIRLEKEPPDPDPDKKLVALSITVLGSQELFVGVSEVNEFQQIAAADWARLAKALKEQKLTAFFSDREFVEIGFTYDAPASTVVPVIGAACRAGFRQMALLETKDLSANVPL